jgi:DNA invertase Pin-like site-specific DNA recombinase
LIQVLVVPALRQLGRNLVEVVQALMHLSQRRVALVALGERRATPDGGERIEGMIDTTNPLGAAKLEGLLAVLLPIQAALRREHAQVARIRSSRGGDGFGRPRLAIAPLEVRGLWEGTSSRRPQSTREIAKSLGVGPTSIRKVLAELKAAGELDEARRRANIERLGGPKRGGREKSKSRLTVERVFEGLLAGTTTTQDLAEKLGCSTAVIRRHLARLRKDGRIREAQP